MRSSKRVVWSNIVIEKLFSYRNEYYTNEEVHDYLINLVIETENLLLNPVISKTYTEEYGMYAGAVILIYGNLVSLGVEYLQNKWFKNNTWLFIALHGVFGTISGFAFEFSFFTVIGVMAALFYACIDRLIFRREKENRGNLWFFLTPILLFGLLWGYFQLISPPLPPFTQDDAVEFATSGEGTLIDLFPKKVGIWEGTVDGFQVVRKTSVKETGYETYMVTFTETWSNEQSQGEWYMSYKVERGTLSASGEGGEKPPYHE